MEKCIFLFLFLSFPSPLLPSFLVFSPLPSLLLSFPFISSLLLALCVCVCVCVCVCFSQPIVYAVIFGALLSPFCILLWLYLRTCGWGRKPIKTGENGEDDFPSDILFADAQQPLDTSRASANFLSSSSFVLPRPLPFLASYNALDTVLGVQDLRRHK